MIFAAIRGACGAPTAPTDSEALRKTVEGICRAAAVTEVQTEMAGDKQVRVTLTLHSQAEWQTLYAQMQSLPELGDHGILFRVHVKP
jgi:hypothetical protein